MTRRHGASGHARANETPEGTNPLSNRSGHGRSAKLPHGRAPNALAPPPTPPARLLQAICARAPQAKVELRPVSHTNGRAGEVSRGMPCEGGVHERGERRSMIATHQAAAAHLFRRVAAPTSQILSAESAIRGCLETGDWIASHTSSRLHSEIRTTATVACAHVWGVPDCRGPAFWIDRPVVEVWESIR